ncbi:MAG: recombinase family protein [Candidatus Zixiibacteriota bacterium]
MVRCALYCRLSVSDGNENGFSSIVSQREACEAFVASQRAEGWVQVNERFEDDGYSGGTIERPALKRLLAAIDAGEIDCVVVYKIDRLSRSLLDFVRLLEIFEAKGVSFAAVSQQISTTSSAGRLMLNVLMSFAQFEREIISERTSDKMCAARRKGKWLGGPPILGYDLDREKHRLIVNPDEAEMVNALFRLYLQHQSSLQVAQILNRRAWSTKSWVMKNGRTKSGTPWNKNRVLAHLTNVTYTGKVLHKGEVYDGEHEGIIPQETFDQVQALVYANGYGCGAAVRNKHGALLKGLLRCGRCGAAMAHTYTNKKGTLYRYYQCVTRAKGGSTACDSPSLAANDVEAFVVKQIRQIGKDPAVVDAVYVEAVRQQQSQTPALEAEQRRLQQDRNRRAEEIKRLTDVIADSEVALPSVSDRLGEAEASVMQIDARLRDLRDQLASLRSQTINAEHLRETLAKFDPIWEALHQSERIDLVHQVVDAVVYNPDTSDIQVTLRQHLA